MMKKVLNYFRNKDEMSDPGYNFLHYDADKRQKTLIGGIASVCVQCTLGFIAVTKGQKMVKSDGTNFLSVESAV